MEESSFIESDSQLFSTLSSFTSVLLAKISVKAAQDRLLGEGGSKAEPVMRSLLYWKGEIRGWKQAVIQDWRRDQVSLQKKRYSLCVCSLGDWMACFRQQYGRRIRFGGRGVEDIQVRMWKLVGCSELLVLQLWLGGDSTEGPRDMDRPLNRLQGTLAPRKAGTELCEGEDTQVGTEAQQRNG